MLGVLNMPSRMAMHLACAVGVYSLIYRSVRSRAAHCRRWPKRRCCTMRRSCRRAWRRAARQKSRCAAGCAWLLCPRHVFGPVVYCHACLHWLDI